MSKASTLQRVIDDIAHKDLGKARDRLLGLLRAYPNDLVIRHILGRIYLELQYPQEAGRYLYLIDDQSDEVQKAIAHFLKSMQNDPGAVLKILKLEGHIKDFPAGYAKDRLLMLYEESKKRGQRPSSSLKDIKPGRKISLGENAVAIGCGLTIAAALIIGVIEILKAVYNGLIGLFR